MSRLNNQKKQFLTDEIASRIMEYLMGLSERNKALVRTLAGKSSKKIVEVYYKALQSQYRKVSKTANKREKEAIKNDTLFFERQINLIAS